MQEDQFKIQMDAILEKAVFNHASDFEAIAGIVCSSPMIHGVELLTRDYRFSKEDLPSQIHDFPSILEDRYKDGFVTRTSKVYADDQIVQLMVVAYEVNEPKSFDMVTVELQWGSFSKELEPKRDRYFVYHTSTSRKRLDEVKAILNPEKETQ